MAERKKGNITMLIVEVKEGLLAAIPETAKASAANKATIKSINSLASTYKADKYLEIGVRTGGTFFYVNMPCKVGVDPAFAFEENEFSCEGRLFFRETSDVFFARLKEYPNFLPAAFSDVDGKPTFDIIFIDGLHTFEQCFRDFQNSIPFAHENTIWLLDDTVPSDPFSSLPDQAVSLAYRKAARVAGKPWHGDVFKTVLALHDFCPEYSYCTLMRGSPQTVVWRAGRGERKPVFGSMEAIARLDYFAVLRHAALFIPVKESALAHLPGMRLYPSAYGGEHVWKQFLYYPLRNAKDWRKVFPLVAQHTAFPGPTQKCILACCKPFIRLFAPLEHLIKFEQDPSDFFARPPKLPGRLFTRFLSCFGPKPERTGFRMQEVKKFLGKQ